MKLPRIHNPFKVNDLMIYIRYEGGKVSVESRQLPYVVRFTMHFLERAAVPPEQLGYRRVGNAHPEDWPFCGALLYARPWLVWAACRIGYWMSLRWRGLIGALARAGFLTFTSPEWEIPRLRNYRPGRRCLHPWRHPHLVKLSRDNWIWWFDHFWFHHKIRLICWWELHRHGYTWREARELLED